MQPIVFRFLLDDTAAPDFAKAVQWLKDNLDQEVTINNQMGNMAMCDFYGQAFTYNHIPAQHPLEFFAKDDLDDGELGAKIKGHQSQATIMAGMYDDEDFRGLVNAWRTCSLVAMAINNTAGNSLIMIDTGELVLAPEVFNNFVLQKVRSHEVLPVEAWIKFGLGSNEGGNFGYTKGVKAHGLKELEIINSELSHDQIFELLRDVASYSILHHVKFKDGETFGYSDEMKIPISKEKGTFVEKKVFRLNV